MPPSVCSRVGETLQRLGLAGRTLAADARRPRDWWDGEPFDAILLDAPCSASGIVRRHPDIRWLRRPGDIGALVPAPRPSCSTRCGRCSSPAGGCSYATCSIFKAEGCEQIDAFLQRLGPDGARLDGDSPGHLLPLADNRPLSPEAALADGFYYVLLHKPVGR